MSKHEPPVVERTYSPDHDACVRALEHLLKKKAAGRDGGEYRRVKGDTDARAERSIRTWSP